LVARCVTEKDQTKCASDLSLTEFLLHCNKQFKEEFILLSFRKKPEQKTGLPASRAVGKTPKNGAPYWTDLFAAPFIFRMVSHGYSISP